MLSTTPTISDKYFTSTHQYSVMTTSTTAQNEYFSNIENQLTELNEKLAEIKNYLSSGYKSIAFDKLNLILPAVIIYLIGYIEHPQLTDSIINSLELKLEEIKKQRGNLSVNLVKKIDLTIGFIKIVSLYNRKSAETLNISELKTLYDEFSAIYEGLEDIEILDNKQLEQVKQIFKVTEQAISERYILNLNKCYIWLPTFIEQVYTGNIDVTTFSSDVLEDILTKLHQQFEVLKNYKGDDIILPKWQVVSVIFLLEIRNCFKKRIEGTQAYFDIKVLICYKLKKVIISTIDYLKYNEDCTGISVEDIIGEIELNTEYLDKRTTVISLSDVRDKINVVTGYKSVSNDFNTLGAFMKYMMLMVNKTNLLVQENIKISTKYRAIDIANQVIDLKFILYKLGELLGIQQNVNLN